MLWCATATACAAIANIQDPTEDPILPESDAGPDSAPTRDAKPSCTPGGSASDGPGRLHAKKADPAPVIDGAFDDWSCADTLSIGVGERANAIPAGSTADVGL